MCDLFIFLLPSLTSFCAALTTINIATATAAATAEPFIVVADVHRPALISLIHIECLFTTAFKYFGLLLLLIAQPSISQSGQFKRSKPNALRLTMRPFGIDVAFTAT